MIARVLVGAAVRRPPSDQTHRVVLVAGETEAECSLLAAQMVGAHDDIVMTTSTCVLDLLEW